MAHCDLYMSTAVLQWYRIALTGIVAQNNKIAYSLERVKEMTFLFENTLFSIKKR